MDRRSRRLLTLLSLLFLNAPGVPAADRGRDIPYTVPPIPWEPGLGNHRAVIEVPAASGVVHALIPWRRRDEDPSKKRIIVVDSSGNRRVENVLRLTISQESGEFLFGPAPSAGKYFVYYMPYAVQTHWGWYEGDYLAPETTASDLWTKAYRLSEGMNVEDRPDVVRGRVIAFQSRTDFDSFYPMEIPATADETARFLRKRPEPYCVFSEDRAFPIRMRKNLPRRWVDRDAESVFRGKAGRNEYYAFQIGLFAGRKSLDSVTLEFGPLRRIDGAGSIPVSALTCFTTGGVNARGIEFAKSVDVPKGAIQAFWIGVDIPRDAAPGTYGGRVAVKPANASPVSVPVLLEILDTLLTDRGDSAPWRHSRLRWLNSRAGLEKSVIEPYVPVSVRGTEIEVLGRTLRLGSNGMPESITSWGSEILAAPVRFDVEPVSRTPGTRIAAAVTEMREDMVSWCAGDSLPGLESRIRGTMEFDGTIRYRIVLRAAAEQDIRDIRLAVPFVSRHAGLFMGMGKEGCATPVGYRWKWSGPQDSYWMGSPFAGLHCEFRGGAYHGPMLNLYHPPPPESWDNGGKGEFRIEREGDAVTTVWSTGTRRIARNDSLVFEFAFLITPVKKLDPVTHFRDRYFHGFPPGPDSVAIRAGVRVINVHHATAVNPTINYPFIAVDTMRSFVRQWQARGFRVKIYYTVRELTNHVTELWALRSLGTEVLAGGKGGGFPWLREHLEGDYQWQWYQPFDDGTADAALLTSGESRWYNYYVEGLRWLTENAGIDGLYLDDVTYDRTILQRMRRVMQQVKRNCLIDLHSNTGFSIGPANQYAEFFPYVDKLWFGESFRYDAMSPENWMTEVSGIPYGLMGDMLQGGGNPWRGMLYGMTTRLPWGTENVVCDPRNIWQLWDDFGIDRSTMVGYWESDPPVRTDNPLVPATSYLRDGAVLVALASWDSVKTKVSLTIDWKRCGLDPSTAVIEFPRVRELQQSRTVPLTQPISIDPLKGALIIIRKGDQVRR